MGGRSADQAGGRLESLGPRRGTPRLVQNSRNRELATGGQKSLAWLIKVNGAGRLLGYKDCTLEGVRR